MKINYNQPILQEHLNLDEYNAKFKYVDDIKQACDSDTGYKPAQYELNNIGSDPTKFAYFFLKDDQNNPLRLYPYQDMILNDKHDRIYFRSGNQIGKVVDENVPVLTNKGWKKHGELVVGDLVYGSDGNLTKVLVVFPHYNWQFYKLTFDDGAYTYVGAEHLWICKTERERFRKRYVTTFNKWVIRSTDEIIMEGGYYPTTRRNGKKVSIPVTRPIVGDFSLDINDIEPYFLGAWLGDGCRSGKYSAKLTTLDKQIVTEISKYYTVVPCKNGKDYIIRGLGNKLRKLSLLDKTSHNKYVPRQFLHSLISQRKELLNGLMDTDGSVYGKYSTLEYCTISKQLKDDFILLVNSLGGLINKVTEKKPFYYDKNRNKVYGKLAYVIRFKVLFNPFKLQRKRLKWKPVSRYRHERIIEKIEKAHIGDGSCIIVDNKDHSYLISTAFIVTHNSFTFNVKAVWNLLRDHGYAHHEAIVSKSLPQSTFQMRRVKALLNTMKVNWKDGTIDGKTTTDSLTLLTYDIKEKKTNKVKYTNMLVCTPCTEGLLGYDLHELNLDEFEYWTDVDLKWFYNQIAQPRLYTTKGRIMIMTNPNGSDNFGTDLENQTMKDESKRFHTYVFNYLNKPGNTQEEYDQLKHELSRQEFESTVAAIRSISSLCYFSPDEINRSYDAKLTELDMIGKQPFFFLDVGAKHDQSCLIGGYTEPHTEYEKYKFMEVFIPIIHMYPIGYPLTRVAGVDVDDSDGWHYEKSVKEYLKEWSKDGTLPVFGFDVTGNAGMAALFEAIQVDAQDTVFSGPNKSGMYQRYKYVLEKGLLHRIKHREWESQAGQVIATKGVRGYLFINAASHVKKGGKTEDAKLKKIPDDTQDATAGFIQLCDPMGIVEPSLEVF